MLYITDAGASCGANFNNLGAKAGITIVGGHEFAETETDIFPNGGWLDSSGAENGDKCAWISSGQGASANVSLGGSSFPVQSLWSNAFNSGAGGCVLSY
jgi:serine protease